MKRVFLLGCAAGALGFILSVTAADWLFNQTTQWISRRNENNAATMLIDALTKGELVCTNGPLRLAHTLINAKILVLPRGPLQHAITIEENTTNIVLYGVSIEIHTGSEILRNAAIEVLDSMPLSPDDREDSEK